MKSICRIIVVMTFIAAPLAARAQVTADPEGGITYSLPSTVITIEADAVHEKFYAGPYAKYAEKYLGIKARQKDESVVQLTALRITPYVEPDLGKRYFLPLGKNGADLSFLKLSCAGLVSFGNGNFGGTTAWRFPTGGEGDFSDKGVSSNLTSESATLFRNARKEAEYNKVSVQQNMIVEKSLEKRAAETAEMILELRRQRLQIVTGDTDATYNGEAMGAAVNEITRLEKEYMTLFIGYTETQVQSMNFDVVPHAGTLHYVAFRLSDTAGLVPADNLSGKPVIMEIQPQAIEQVAVPVTDDPRKKKEPLQLGYYRIPAVCTVKLTEGVELLLQTRIPVYQFGQECSFPVNLNTK